MSEAFDFDYVDLNLIDPEPEKLPAGMYTVQLAKAELQSGVSQRTGKPFQRITIQLVVQDDERFAGRRLFESLFAGEYGIKALRRIMDATGIQQQPGEPVAEWLKRVALERPSFKVMVRLEDDKDYATGEVRIGADGQPAKRNSVNWYQVVPA